MQKINDHSEAFDYAFAIWYWLSHNHEGQYCEKYAVMSSMPNKHGMTNIPDINFDDENFDDENYGAISIYHEINENNWNEYSNEFERYMKFDWNNDE